MTDTEQLAAIIQNSKNTVFFGGAGVSTESGIPDFRGEKGLYHAQSVYGYPPEYLISHSLFKTNPQLFFRYYKDALIARDARPNPAHISLAELEKMCLLSAVITQNIDGLHQAAGSKTVYELHGSNLRQYCQSCGKKYSLDYILDDANCDEAVPKCAECGGIVRPDVVLYQESLDEKVIQAAINAISGAATLIVGGTSLVVYPAAGLLRYFSGENLVLINKTETSADSVARLIIHDSIGKVLSETLKLIRQK